MENLKIVYLPVTALTPYERNAKEHPPEQIEQIKKSIQDYGMDDPIGIWGEKNIIVEGHGRLLACKALGFTEVPCIRLDHMTDAQRREYALVHNQTTMNSPFNSEMLDLELGDLLDFDAEFFGFDKSEQEKIDEAKGKLADAFIVPPLSILDSRQAYWQERKKQWHTLIRDNGAAREGGNDLFAQRNKFVKRVKGKAVRESSSASLLDPVLCEILCQWFIPNTDPDVPKKCFDCFAGDTSFGFVASYLGHEFVGTELRQSQADFNQRRCDEFNLPAKYICDDGRNIDKHLAPESMDFFFSCPPYYDMEVYSDDANDASNQETYEDFYAIIDEAFSRAAKCLKKNRFAAVVCQDVRGKNGAYYGFPEDIVATFERNGCHLYNRLCLIRTVGSAAMFARTSMNTTRKARAVHEEVLVFFSGDGSELQTEDDVVDAIYRDFLAAHQNVEAFADVLVFFNGNEKEIKRDFAELGGKDES